MDKMHACDYFKGTYIVFVVTAIYYVLPHDFDYQIPYESVVLLSLSILNYFILLILDKKHLDSININSLFSKKNLLCLFGEIIIVLVLLYIVFPSPFFSIIFFSIIFFGTLLAMIAAISWKTTFFFLIMPIAVLLNRFLAIYSYEQIWFWVWVSNSLGLSDIYLLYHATREIYPEFKHILDMWQLP